MYLYLMSKLCNAMESCTFLSFYCKYRRKKKLDMLPGLHSSALVKKRNSCHVKISIDI